jgi:hypothetical protein
MNITCPRCQMLLDCPPELSGQQATCPRCGTLLAIPEPAPIVRTSRTTAKRPKPDNTLLYLIGGLAVAILCIVATVLLVDELRFWNAKRHVKEELKEIDRQFQKADRDIKRAAEQFEKMNQ